ncbi:hypothetical protein IAR55_005604 [Kwoniella newhampshirensis]|uniref:Uncharacterized protein n=1 Tax=Kwoniella newhampshirensis TaxID=1651941 RepID=A0AAW0YV75_9TREE
MQPHYVDLGSSASSSRSTLSVPLPTNGTGSGSASASGSRYTTPGGTRLSPDQYREIIQEFKGYPFTLDADFKAGLPTVLAAIRNLRLSALGADEMIAKAQWFYFIRKKQLDLPWSVYASHLQSPSPSSSPSSRGTPQNHRRQLEPAKLEGQRMMAPDAVAEGDGGMSFEMLCRLVAEGRADEMKGETIPDELNSAPPTASTLLQRPKPWQQAGSQLHTIDIPPAKQLPPTPVVHNVPFSTDGFTTAFRIQGSATRSPEGGQLTLSPEIPLTPAYLASLSPPESWRYSDIDTPYIPENLNMEVEIMEHLAQVLNGRSLRDPAEEVDAGGGGRYEQWYGAAHGPHGDR